MKAALENRDKIIAALQRHRNTTSGDSSAPTKSQPFVGDDGSTVDQTQKPDQDHSNVEKASVVNDAEAALEQHLAAKEVEDHHNSQVKEIQQLKAALSASQSKNQVKSLFLFQQCSPVLIKYY